MKKVILFLSAMSMLLATAVALAMPEHQRRNSVRRPTVVVQNAMIDSTIWDRLRMRRGDVVIATYAKSGTTWMQQIVSQLIFKGQKKLPVSELSPWLDAKLGDQNQTLQGLVRQKNRRFIKTHLPATALPIHSKARYIYVARDGRDVVMSAHNHQEKFAAGFLASLPKDLKSAPLLQPPTKNRRSYFKKWLKKDGEPWWPYWHNVSSWLKLRNEPNVKVVHFANLKKDLRGEIKEIARFLEISVDEKTLDTIVKHCTFDWMKKNASATVPLAGVAWTGGAKSFMNKGTNRQWKDVLTARDVAQYKATADHQLGKPLAEWLATGNKELLK